MVLVDGCRQQRAELFSALRNYLKRATVGSCMFHIAQQNWKKMELVKIALKRRTTHIMMQQSKLCTTGYIPLLTIKV